MVGPQGTFGVTATRPLADGEHTLRVSTPVGSASVERTLTVDTRPTVLTSPTEGSTVVDDAAITVTGKSAAFRYISIVDGRRSLARATADANGNWSVVFARSAAYTYFGAGRIAAVDDSGNKASINITWARP